MLRAIAVVHIEIHHRHALGPVRGLRMARGDGGAVEKAEAHGNRALGMVAGRAHGDKGVMRLARHHRIHGGDRAASGAQRRLPGAGRHGRVSVKPDQPLGG